MEAILLAVTLILWPPSSTGALSQATVAALFPLLITGIAVAYLGQTGTFRRNPSLGDLQQKFGQNAATYLTLLKKDSPGSSGDLTENLSSLSLIEGLEIQVTRFSSGYEIRLTSKDSLNIRGVFTGIGRINSVLTGGRYSSATTPTFALLDWSEGTTRTLGVSQGSSLAFNVPDVFPVEGYFRQDLFHYFVAPTARLDIPGHGDAIVMIFEPSTKAFHLSPSKTSLSVDYLGSKCSVTLQGGDKLTGKIVAQGGDLDWARLTLLRLKPGVKKITTHASPDIVEEQLAELKQPGESEFSWSPVRPAFGPTAVMLKSSPSNSDLTRLAEQFGIQTSGSFSARSPNQFILGDGIALRYWVRLSLHPSRRGVRLAVTSLTLQ